VLPLPSFVELRRRVPRCILGLVVFGAGIATFVRAQLGLSPWDVFHQGLSHHFGLAMGTWTELIGLAILLLWIPLRQRIGLGTLLNAVLIGLSLDLVLPHLPTAQRVLPRAGYFALGLLAVGIGSGLYIGAGLGTGPRDGLMMGLHKRGLSVRLARTMIETCALAGGSSSVAAWASAR
jgi:uncharacterized membrane protein YczE